MYRPGSTRRFGRTAVIHALLIALLSTLFAPAVATAKSPLPASRSALEVRGLVQPADTYDNQAQSVPWDLLDGAGINLAATSSTGEGVIVAVLDTGYIPHPDLEGQLLPGYDFVSSAPSGYVRFSGSPQTLGDIDGDVMSTAKYGRVGRDSNPMDPGSWFYLEDGRLVPSTWHGTHVSGTIAALSGNAVGVDGIAPAAKLLPVRVLGWAGGLSSDIIDGIVWASGGHVLGVPDNRNPADIINLSLSVEESCSSEYQHAINIARANGAIVVVAAGNSAKDVASSSPANCEGVVAVGASNALGERARYSNFGTGVDFYAPGGDFVSGVNGGINSTIATTNSGFGDPAFKGASIQPGYGYMQGTSMAAPHVSAVLALIKSRYPAWGESRVLARAHTTAQSLAAGAATDQLISAAASAGQASAPAIAKLSQSIAAAGSLLRVFGGNLEGVDRVSIGAVAAKFALLSDDSLLVEVPLTARSGSIEIHSSAGVATTALTVNGGRAAVSLKPLARTRLKPDTWLLLQGKNIGLATASIGGRAAVVRAVDANHVRLFIPGAVVDGQLVLTTSVGSLTSSQRLAFPPRLISLEVRGGTGQRVVLRGENLSAVDYVQLFGLRVRPRAKSQSKLVFVVPRSAVSAYSYLAARGGRSGDFWFEKS